MTPFLSILLVLAAAPAAAPPAPASLAAQELDYTPVFDAEREPVCIWDVILADQDHGSRMTMAMAVKLCTDHFKWTPALQSKAIAIARITGESLGARDEAVAEGVSESDQAKFFESVTDAERASIGTVNGPMTPERTAALRGIAQRILALGLSEEAAQKLGAATIYRARMFNLIIDFLRTKETGTTAPMPLNISR